MRHRKSPILFRFIFFIGISLLLNLSCNKDTDTLYDAVLQKETPPVEESDPKDGTPSENDAGTDQEGDGDQESNDEQDTSEVAVEELGQRTTAFPLLQDAYLQDGQGYNEPLVRLEEDRRKSYLMFDLSPIDSISGTITSARLQWVVHEDDGNGKIEVFKGASSDWTENDLTDKSAPEAGVLLGSVSQEYAINDKISIDLNAAELPPRPTTFILRHKDGDDLAFASKENGTAESSQLIVTYDAPITADTLVVALSNDRNEPSAVGEQETGDEETGEQEEAVEEDESEGNEGTTEAEIDQEEIAENDTDEKGETEEGTDQEDSSQEDEKVTETETVEEETPGETASEEEGSQESSEEADSTEEGTEQEETTQEEDPEEEEQEQKSQEIPEESESQEEAPDDTANEEEDSQEASEEAESTEEATDQQETDQEEDPEEISGEDQSQETSEQGEGEINSEEKNNEGEESQDTSVAGEGEENNPEENSEETTDNEGEEDQEENSEESTEDEGDEQEEQDGQETPVESDSSPPTVPPNSPPITLIEAAPLTGTAPLTVSFDGIDSSDDKAIVSYKWNFGDGATAATALAEHTFDSAGSYEVLLKTTDEEGLSATETVTVEVDQPQNEPPVAVAKANTLDGEAPLQIDFSGGDSYDDQGIVSYQWNLPGNASSDQEATHTFSDPGIYEITLTVTDEAGLTASDLLLITVNQAEAATGSIDCSEGGGMALETGEKAWCWNNIDIPEYSGGKGVAFGRGLFVDSECYDRQVTREGNRLKFRLDPTGPEIGDWCSKDFNLRAEIRTEPWQVRHPKGTEEWFGWSYTFGNNYKIDLNNQWKFFQVHNGVVGKPPQIGLEIIHGNQFIGHNAGEIFVTNAGGSQKYNPTGIVPRAGQTIDVVVHAVWDDASNGLLQVWIDGQKVYDKQVSTILPGDSWAGNAKWGIYKWPWADENRVQKSKGQGISHLETYMGPLRIITRRPGDPEYRKDSYSRVVPR